MKPTHEQDHCAAQFQTGCNTRVNAFAGTGKTSTLVHLAKSTTRRGTYMAFNRSIAEEAKRKFPSTVACSTTHSLAYRHVIRRGYSKAKMEGKINGGILAAKLGLQPHVVGEGAAAVFIRERGLGFLICETIRRWAMSGTDRISQRHVRLEGKLALLPAAERKHLIADITKRANQVWARMRDRDDDMPLGHDGYLKLWALSRPVLAGDFVLLDEAQDTNGVVMRLVKDQPAHQLVIVGDRYQQIYEWRGATNAMTELPAELEAVLTTSFRFGPEIAEHASEILRLLGASDTLKGNPERDGGIGSVANPDAILARTNAVLIGELIAALDAGETPHVVGGVAEMLRFLAATEQLMAGQSVEYPILFFGFKDWNEVKAATRFDDEDTELAQWVSLVEKYGTAGLRAALSRVCETEDEASLILSTGHKAKGREWNEVRLTDDFLRGVRVNGKDKNGQRVRPDPEMYAAELRLLYVAATRGRLALEIPPSLTEKLIALGANEAPVSTSPNPFLIAEADAA